MGHDEDLLELKAKHKLLESRFQAIVNLLSREGILTKTDVDDELERLVQMEEHER